MDTVIFGLCIWRQLQNLRNCGRDKPVPPEMHILLFLCTVMGGPRLSRPGSATASLYMVSGTIAVYEDRINMKNGVCGWGWGMDCIFVAGRLLARRCTACSVFEIVDSVCPPLPRNRSYRTECVQRICDPLQPCL